MGWAELDPETSTERALITILADVSGSMGEEITAQAVGNTDSPTSTRIDALVEGLRTLVNPNSSNSMHEVSDLDAKGEFALGLFSGDSNPAVQWVQFQNVRITQLPFYFLKDITDLQRTQFRANGKTPMGEAILETLPIIESRRRQVRDEEGLSVKRPILFLITDGRPSDSRKFQEAIKALHKAEEAKHVLTFAFATYGASIETIRKLAPERTYDLRTVPMAKLIEFFSTTLGAALSANPDADTAEVAKYVNDKLKIYQEHRAAMVARGIFDYE